VQRRRRYRICGGDSVVKDVAMRWTEKV
jgi:hypothetical protein